MNYEEYCNKMKKLIFSRRRIAFSKLQELLAVEGMLNKKDHFTWPDALIHISNNMFLVSYTAGYNSELTELKEPSI